MPDTEAVVVRAIRRLLSERHDERDVTMASALVEDLRLDSLELADLSAMLERELGTDPYSEGLAPRTVSEVVGFYDG